MSVTFEANRPIKIGDKFISRSGKRRAKGNHELERISTVIDIYKTYNDAGDLIKIKYLCSKQAALNPIQSEETATAIHCSERIEDKS